MKAKLTQVELAEAIGCTRQTIISLERGLTNPGYMLTYLIAKRLGFTLEDILPNFNTHTCVCHLFGPAECRVCHPDGYKK